MRSNVLTSRRTRRLTATVLFVLAVTAALGLADGGGAALAFPAFDQYAPVAPGPDGDRHIADGSVERDHEALVGAVRARAAEATGNPSLNPRRTSTAPDRYERPRRTATRSSGGRENFARASGTSLVDNIFSSFGLAAASLVATAAALVGRRGIRKSDD